MDFYFSETSSNNQAPAVDSARECSNRGVRRGRWQCLEFIVTEKTVLKLCFVTTAQKFSFFVGDA